MLKHSKLMMETHKPMEYYGILWRYMEVRLAWKLDFRVSSSIYGDVTGCTGQQMLCPGNGLPGKRLEWWRPGASKSIQNPPMETCRHIPDISMAYDQWSYLS